MVHQRHIPRGATVVERDVNTFGQHIEDEEWAWKTEMKRLMIANETGSISLLVPSEKPTNPKDAVGINKVPMSTVSAPVLAEVGLGMLEGACKYGRHNYRAVGVRASVYYDATLRHLFSWWEGQDLDPDSDADLHHVSKAIASLVVLRDAMIQDKLEDDRPPSTKDDRWLGELNDRAAEIIAQYADRHPKHYTIGDNV